MLEITLESQNKNTLKLSRENGFIITNVDGLNPQSSSLNFMESSIVDGRTWTGSHVSGRDITISFYIEKEPERARKLLYKIARPKDKITIHFDDQDTTYKASGYIANVDVGYFEEMTKAQIGMQCEGAYLEKDGTNEHVSENTVKKFSFPFHTNSGESIIFGTTSNKATLIVENAGEVETGAIFRLKSTQSINNPTITNINTGESMGISGELPEDSILEISTESGHRSISFISKSTGKKTNKLSKKASVFHWLPIYLGTNIFEVQCSGDKRITVECIFSERYIGI